MTTISYGNSEEAWAGFEPLIADFVATHQLKSICDLGGGANPLLNPEYIRSEGIDYCILDISEAELAKAPAEYKKIQADISARDLAVDSKFDLVFSKMLAEHVKDAEQFHKNILSMLNDGGIAIHFFPTLYTLPFVVNRLTPERLAEKLLNFFAPRDPYQHAKFPAYYSWCRGPTRGQIKKFTNLGYEVVEYRGYFGHAEYYNRLKPIKKLHELKTRYLLNNSRPMLTSYALVVLRKPPASAAAR